MKRHVWVVGSLSLVAICSLFLQQASRGDGRSLTVDEMRATCGSTSGGCVLSGPLTDCNLLDEVCNLCLDSMSRETVEGSGPFGVKIYLGADRRICTVPTTNNNKVCDPGTVVCWTERSCDPGPVQVDKSCNADQAGNCVTPNTEGTWFCRKYSLGGPTGINKTKNDDDCV